MKQLLTAILLFASLSVMAQNKTAEFNPEKDKREAKEAFQNSFETLIQDYFKDCYNDSTKVEVHRQLTEKEALNDPCTIAWINQGSGFTQICENKRHSEIKYVHAEPRDFGRFLLWVEERRKQ